jgi:phytol kinase
VTKAWLGLAAVWVALPGLMAAVRWAGARNGWSGETKRKLVHVGMGLSTLTFPWWFPSWEWVAVLGAGCVALLAWTRRREIRDGGASVLHDVDRASWGEICFPVAVTAVFAMARGEAWRFVIPILVLTLADAAGAWVGVRYGRQKFRVFSGWKSLEGSLLVFFVAFLSIHVPLLLMTGTGRAETLLVALALAMLAMLVEAVSVRGLDNLVLPVLMATLLPKYAEMEAGPLGLRVVVGGGLLALVLAGRKDSSLEGGALMAAVLLGYGLFFFGDWRFVVPPVILFAEHLGVSRRLRGVERARPRERNDLWVVAGLAAGGAGWVAAAWWTGDETSALRGWVATCAVHLACQNFTTRRFVSRHVKTNGSGWRAVEKAAVWVLLPGWACSGWDRELPGAAALAAASLPVGLMAFRKIMGDPAEYPNDRKRWLAQGAVALVAGLPAGGIGMMLGI